MYCHHASSLAFVCLVNSACLHTLSFVTYFSHSQAHTQSCNIIGHLRTHSQSRNIIGHLCTHSSSHNTIGQCLLYNMSHTAVSLVLYAVDKGLRWRNVLQNTVAKISKLGIVWLTKCHCKYCWPNTAAALEDLPHNGSHLTRVIYYVEM